MVDRLVRRIDQRIVGDRIRLDLHLPRDGGQAVHHRAEKLRQAADRIAVLQKLAVAVVAVAVQIVLYQLRPA